MKTVENALVDEVKGLLEPMLKEFIATGVLQAPVLLDALAMSPERIVDNVVIALIREAVRESVVKLFREKYGAPKTFSGSDKQKLQVANMIIEKVVGFILQDLNAVIGSALAGPFGALASIVVTAYEEVLLEQLLAYNGSFILEALEVSIPEGAYDPRLAEGIHVDLGNYNNQSTVEAIASTTQSLEGWTPDEIRVWRESGYVMTADRQRQAQAQIQQMLGRTQAHFQTLRGPIAQSTPLLSGVRDSPFDSWENPSWEDGENYRQQERYRPDDNDLELLNTHLY